MNLANVRQVLFKEIRETLRDRRTILVMLVVPVFLYPVLMIVVQQLVLLGQRSMQERQVTVAVVGDTAPLPVLRADTALRVTRSDTLPMAALRAGEVHAVLEVQPAPAGGVGTQQVRLFYDASRDASGRARDLVERRFEEWGDSALAGRLRDRGLPASFAEPIAVADTSIATAEQLGGYALGRFLPLLLILMTLLGAFFPAIDLTAGEKERGTLETLLTTPVPARDIIAGKFLTVVATAMTTALLNMVSMLLTFESGVFQLSRATKIDFGIPVATGLLVVLLMIPLAVFFAALCLGVAVRAQSFKEAQTALTPLQFAAIVPMYLPIIPGIELSYPVALVPIGGIAVLFRDLMAGQAEAGPALVAVGAMALYALLALRFASRMFGREEVLFGSGSGATDSATMRERLAAWRAGTRATPRPSEALAFVAAIGLLYFYLGVRLQVAWLERGLFASQWLLLALPALLFAVLGPFRARSTLALRAPTPRGLAAATLIIAGGLPVGWVLGYLQGLYLEVPQEYLETFQKLLSASSPERFAWLILLIAVTPAVCEELVFRGVLLQGLSRELPMRRAVVGSAVIFGAFHLSFETVIRFLPTAWLGLLMGYVVWHTRSIFTSMWMHFLANATAVVLVSTTGLQAYIFGPSGTPRWLAVGGAGIALAAGLYLLPRRGAEPVAPEAEEGADLSTQRR